MRDTTRQLKTALETKIGLKTLYVKGVFVAEDGRRFTVAGRGS